MPNKSPCAFPSDNHSDDRIDVYHGSTTPTTLCGYHASWNLNTVLAEIRNPHVTTIHHNGFKHYFTCAAGDVNHTDNAYTMSADAEAAAQSHRDQFTTNPTT